MMLDKHDYSVWLRTGSIAKDMKRIRNHTEKDIIL